MKYVRLQTHIVQYMLVMFVCVVHITLSYIYIVYDIVLYICTCLAITISFLVLNVVGANFNCRVTLSLCILLIIFNIMITFPDVSYKHKSILFFAVEYIVARVCTRQ